MNTNTLPSLYPHVYKASKSTKDTESVGGGLNGLQAAEPGDEEQKPWVSYKRQEFFSGRKKIALFISALITLLLMLVVLCLLILEPIPSFSYRKLSGSSSRSEATETIPCSPDHNYMVVVDVGSSGSRLSFYEWKETDLVEDGLLPRFKQIWSTKAFPGLSSFSDSIEGIDKYIRSLFDSLYNNLSHKEVAKSIPVYIYATAGMRLLPLTTQNLIMDEVTLVMKRADYPFIFDRSHVQIISGEMEGAYGWLAINYMMDKLNLRNLNDDPTVGFLDLGGASLQLAFEPKWIRESTTAIDIQLLNKTNRRYHVFVTSLLGFGMNEARKSHTSKLSVQNNIEPIPDPCLPSGLEDQLLINNRTVQIQGIGGLDACLLSTRRLLNDVHMQVSANSNASKFPSFPAKMILVGMAEFWNTIQDVFKLGGTAYNYEYFYQLSEKYCSRPWSNIMENYYHTLLDNEDVTIEYRLKNQCFKSAWMITLLHHLFKLPKLNPLGDDGIKFQTLKTWNDAPLSWTLGVVLGLYHHNRPKASNS